MSAQMMDDARLVRHGTGLPATHKSPRPRHGRRRNALPFEGEQTNALTAPMSDDRGSAPAEVVMKAQHGEAPTLYCDRLDETKYCINCGARTHLRFTRPAYPNVIGIYWKCRRCIRKGTSSEKIALEIMLFRNRIHRYGVERYLDKQTRAEAGGLTD